MPTSGAAGSSWFFDTGPLVALLSRDDAAHEGCRTAFEAFRGHLLTTEAVLTEAMHLLGRCRGGPAACLAFFERAGALLVPMSATRLSRCGELIERYGDLAHPPPGAAEDAPAFPALSFGGLVVVNRVLSRL
ncbi:MAG: hypothetical protein HY720_21045 [Planctomycetes bacterium]|nr:hypothetical protein [Planctomycetota bacterium]